jgi:hypothetical protein
MSEDHRIVYSACPHPLLALGKLHLHPLGERNSYHSQETVCDRIRIEQ